MEKATIKEVYLLARAVKNELRDKGEYSHVNCNLRYDYLDEEELVIPMSGAKLEQIKDKNVDVYAQPNGKKIVEVDGKEKREDFFEEEEICKIRWNYLFLPDEELPESEEQLKDWAGIEEKEEEREKNEVKKEDIDKAMKDIKDKMEEKEEKQGDDEVTKPEKQEKEEEKNEGKTEKGEIIRLIKKHEGNKAKIADELPFSRSTLYRKLDEYDIDIDEIL